MSETITIFTTNDIHGRFLPEGDVLNFAKFATYIKNRDNSILVDIGDSTQGTPLAILENGLYPIQILNQLGYDAVTIGNHEFDNIISDGDHCELYKIITEFKSHFIAANVLWKKTNENYISFCYKDSGISDRGNGRYYIKNIAGKTLLFIGISTPAMSLNIPRLKKFIIRGGGEDGIVDDIRRAIVDAKLESGRDRFDMIILMTHLGLETAGYSSNKLCYDLKKEDGITLILDGHSHEKYNKKVHEIQVMQADCYGKLFGEVEIVFKDGLKPEISIAFRDAEFIENQKEDPDVKKLMDELSKKVDEKFGTVRAKSVNTTLWGGAIDETKPYALRAINVSRAAPTNLGSLTGEALVHFIRKNYSTKVGQDEYIIAGQNGGGLRESIAFGAPVTDKDIFYALPSPLNSETETGVSLHRLSFAHLQEMLNNSVSMLSINNKNQIISGDGRLLNTSGIEYELHQKVVEDKRQFTVSNSVNLTCRMDGSGPKKSVNLEEGGTVLVCVNKYLASGGDGYNVFNVNNRLLEDKTPLFKIVGDYISSRTGKERLYYNAFPGDVSYSRCYIPPNPNSLTVTIKNALGVETKNQHFVLSYYDSKGYGPFMPISSDSEGKITITPPGGGNTLCIGMVNPWGKTPDDSFLYGEMFLHTYYSLIESKLECLVSKSGGVNFAQRAWWTFEHTNKNTQQKHFSTSLAYWDWGRNEKILMIINDRLYVRSNEPAAPFNLADEIQCLAPDSQRKSLRLHDFRAGVVYQTFGGEAYAARRSLITGIAFSPLYGAPGTPLGEDAFFDMYPFTLDHGGKIKSIRVRAGEILDGIGFTFYDNKEIFHGFAEGGGETVIPLQEDEYIESISGRYGCHFYSAICDMWITTNKKKYGPFGCFKEGTSFTLGKEGSRIAALYGTSNAPATSSSWTNLVISSLGAYYEPVA